MVERFASEQGGSLHTVSPDCRAVCEQFVRASDYDLLEKTSKYLGECNARNANEANLLGQRVKDLESALCQSRPYVYNAEIADAADLEARHCVLSVIDALLPQADTGVDANGSV